MNRIIINILLMTLAVYAFADVNTRKVEIEYIYQIPDNVSPEQAKETALERAKIQSIADEFGTLVTQNNSTNININNGEVTSSFTSLGGSEVKGEWIETIGTPLYEFITQGDALAIKVNVKGRIRELTSQKVPISVKTFRNGVDLCNESNEFMSGDALYMSFKAPSNGFLAVYLVDSESNVFCLLPYQGQSNGFFDIRSNHQYMLFNKNYAENVDKDIIDEFLLDTEQDREQNKILTIFSPNKFFKAVDSKSQEDLPRNLSSKEFEKWLSNVRKKDTELAISETIITIRK